MKNLQIINNKRGETLIAVVFVTFVCIMITVYIFYYLFNIINVFICYEKLNNIALKYMFILERFGYITAEEKKEMVNDLTSNGFDEENITINVPTLKSKFGEKLELSIEYKFRLDSIIVNNVFSKETEYINLKVKKACYNKI